jgi:hypothetical protein
MFDHVSRLPEKRHVVVDSMGFLLAVLVTSAAVDDGVAAKDVLAMVESEAFPRLRTTATPKTFSNLRVFGPASGGVGEEREVGIQLLGLSRLVS